MTDTDAAPRHRRRWVWVLAAAVVAGVSVPPATYLLIRWQGERELAAVRAELDAADPNWRMPDLFAARNARLAKLEVNSADTAAAVYDRLPEGWEKPPADGEEPLWPFDGPPNRLPTMTQADLTRRTFEAVKAAAEQARTLRDQPAGGTALVVPNYSTYMLDLSLADTQKRRHVARLLAVDAAVAALDTDPATAVQAVHAGLNAARSVSDEPTYISQLVRAACDQVAVRSAERVLGLCEPDAGLVELQAALLGEAADRTMTAGMQGELASFEIGRAHV